MTESDYRPGNSFLYRVDPRVKLLLLLGSGCIGFRGRDDFPSLSGLKWLELN
ncbi:MAG: hypothetical protein PF441_04600 [Desulfuromusa sp.]|jgi:energy-coupling factor transporter transmembrane protein EcfT|nr:hypothetical protein [Desulfuromusa sp.]